MRRQPPDGEAQSPATAPWSPGSTLPGRYTPLVAGYARGPFLAPELVTPSGWRWRNTRAYTIRHSDGHDYRAVRVFSQPGHVFVGYWAVELLGLPLTIEE
jgi:hypothetical protein